MAKELKIPESMVDDNEFQKFMEHNQNKSYQTRRNYTQQYLKLRTLLSDKNIHEVSQARIIKVIQQNVDNINSQAALNNVAVIVRNLYKYDVKELLKHRNQNKVTIQKSTQINNEMIVLPSLNDIDQYIEHLYDTEKWQAFIINYLIRYCFVRNQDLNLTFVDSKKQTEGKKDNFIVVAGPSKMIYIRNDYKTHKTYGTKETTLTPAKLQKAIYNFRQEHGKKLMYQEPQNLASFIQRQTYNNIGEGAMLKVIIKAKKNDMNYLKKISESRGTSLYTLLTSYNIDYKPEKEPEKETEKETN